MGTTAQIRFVQVWPDGRETTEACILVHRDGGKVVQAAHGVCASTRISNGEVPGCVNGIGRFALAVAIYLQNQGFQPEFAAYDPEEVWDYNITVSSVRAMETPHNPEFWLG